MNTDVQHLVIRINLVDDVVATRLRCVVLFKSVRHLLTVTNTLSQCCLERRSRRLGERVIRDISRLLHVLIVDTTITKRSPVRQRVNRPCLSSPSRHASSLIAAVRLVSAWDTFDDTWLFTHTCSFNLDLINLDFDAIFTL